jgi:tetraacyldisaccharide 4'-kinase
MEYRVLIKQMNLYPYQQLFFTTLDYEPLVPVFPKSGGQKRSLALDSLEDKNVLLLTGIASPLQMHTDLSVYTSNILPLTYSDHHSFKKKDVRQINETFENMSSPKLIVTTEKDAVRLRDAEGLNEEVRKNIYALPIKVSFMQDGEESFNEKIIGYVRKNSRNSILAKVKDDHKSKDGNHSGDRPRTIVFRNN